MCHLTKGDLIRVRLRRPSSAGAWLVPSHPATRLWLILLTEERASPHTPTSPQHLNCIMGEYRIMTDEDRFFHVGLGDEQTVKGVPVMCWQVLQCQNMSKGDRQHLEIVGLLLAGDHPCQGQAQVEFTELELDLYFPDTGHTEEHHIRPVLTCRTGLERELGRVTVPPDEGMGIRSTFMVCLSRSPLATARQNPCSSRWPRGVTLQHVA